ncbi:hypothetical protein Tco_1119156 [Tanacetum coccineum]
MTETKKGVVYLNQHNIRSLMKLSEVHKFCDGTLMKIRDNLIDMVNKNELGHGNKSLKGRDWNGKDIKRSNEMLEKINQTLKRREKLRRFEEYVGGRPETIDPFFMFYGAILKKTRKTMHLGASTKRFVFCLRGRIRRGTEGKALDLIDDRLAIVPYEPPKEVQYPKSKGI